MITITHSVPLSLIHTHTLSLSLSYFSWDAKSVLTAWEGGTESKTKLVTDAQVNNPDNPYNPDNPDKPTECSGQ